jgi:ceramide glucosyltransferase
MPVSILKPLKGFDNGIEENIESFFNLDYPTYELLFSVAEDGDPAIAVIQRFMEKYPGVRARLIVGAIEAGPNPKVNNLMVSYEKAQYDLLLISDSNVRVDPLYLKRLVPLVNSNVGVITAVVAGIHASGIGGLLEATYLNTFYARWMHIMAAFGNSPVVGKSMCFRKSSAERFGGMTNLAQYIAEDYMAGQAMRKLGLRTVIMPDPVQQYIGFYQFKTFWSRHLRWGRIRKSQAPLAFIFEPLVMAPVSGIVGALAFHNLFGVPFLAFLLFHLAAWSCCDLLMMKKLEAKVSGRSWVLAWIVRWFAWWLRETLAFPLWIHMACGNTVNWRGRQLRISSGGLLR